MTLTPVAERLAVELSLHIPVFTTRVCRDRGSNSDLPNARRTFYLYATAAVAIVLRRFKAAFLDVDLYLFNDRPVDNVLAIGINPIK